MLGLWSGKIRSIAANVQGNSGVPFMDLRRKQIIRAGIPRLEETVVTALLRRDDGSVIGVYTDITGIKRAEEAVRQLSQHDA